MFPPQVVAAATHDGFVLIKGPPGTGKTTTLLALLNSLYLREYNTYYETLLKKGEQAWRRGAKLKPRIRAIPPASYLDYPLNFWLGVCRVRVSI